MTAALPLPESQPSEPSLSQLLAEEIRAQLARRRSSTNRMAKALGWTQSYASRRMNGIAPFDMNDIERIASYLSMSVVDLVRMAPNSDEVRPTNLRSTPTESTRQYLLETDCTVLAFPLVRRRNAA